MFYSISVKKSASPIQISASQSTNSYRLPSAGNSKLTVSKLTTCFKLKLDTLGDHLQEARRFVHGYDLIQQRCELMLLMKAHIGYTQSEQHQQRVLSETSQVRGAPPASRSANAAARDRVSL
eukprot:2752530-Pleurochrysis_carterae.AAC.1